MNRAANERRLRVVVPLAMLALTLLAWDLAVRGFAIPPYVLPSPVVVATTLIDDRDLLWQSLLVRGLSAGRSRRRGAGGCLQPMADR